jgi:cytoskeletal protein RodZ
MERGLTFGHISNVTKMSSHVLQLIEANEFSRLPGGLLTRGHLRAFATVVGLDPEQIVKEYKAQFESPSPEDEPLHLHSSYHEPGAGAPREAVLLMMALAMVIYFAFVRPIPGPAETATATALDDVAETTTTTTTTISRAAASPVAAAHSDGLQIEVRPRAECWISAIADGRLVIYRLMQEGERQTIDARNEIVLRVGDAGAFAYSVNGGEGRSLGASGDAVTVRITTDNSATFLTNQPAPASARDLNGI